MSGEWKREVGLGVAAISNIADETIDLPKLSDELGTEWPVTGGILYYGVATNLQRLLRLSPSHSLTHLILWGGEVKGWGCFLGKQTKLLLEHYPTNL
jgi:hypothetical protein